MAAIAGNFDWDDLDEAELHAERAALGEGPAALLGEGRAAALPPPNQHAEPLLVSSSSPFLPTPTPSPAPPPLSPPPHPHHLSSRPRSPPRPLRPPPSSVANEDAVAANSSALSDH